MEGRAVFWHVARRDGTGPLMRIVSAGNEAISGNIGMFADVRMVAGGGYLYWAHHGGLFRASQSAPRVG